MRLRTPCLGQAVYKSRRGLPLLVQRLVTSIYPTIKVLVQRRAMAEVIGDGRVDLLKRHRWVVQRNLLGQRAIQVFGQNCLDSNSRFAQANFIGRDKFKLVFKLHVEHSRCGTPCL